MISLLTVITILLMSHTLLMVSPTEFCQSAQFPDYEVGIRIKVLKIFTGKL